MLQEVLIPRLVYSAPHLLVSMAGIALAIARRRELPVASRRVGTIVALTLLSQMGAIAHWVWFYLSLDLPADSMGSGQRFGWIQLFESVFSAALWLALILTALAARDRPAHDAAASTPAFEARRLLE